MGRRCSPASLHQASRSTQPAITTEITKHELSPDKEPPPDGRQPAVAVRHPGDLLSPAHRRSGAIGARRPPCRPRPTRSVDPLADGVGGLGAVEDARGPLAAAVLVADLPAGLGWRGD